MAERRVGIYADDLTGALDAAGPLAAAGLAAFVSMGTSVPPGAANHYEVLSANMDSRRASRAEAVERARRAVESLSTAGFEPIYNKVDSTLRGHLGSEAAVALTAAKAQLMLLCPALPAAGRTVVDGHLLVDGVPVDRTDVGRDPVSPVPASSIAEVLRGNTDLETAMLPLAQVQAGPAPVAEGLDAMAARSPIIIVADAKTDDHLDTLVLAATRCRSRVLMAGSSGLAGAVARAYGEVSGMGQSSGEGRVAGGPYLVVAGSQREVVRAQVQTIQRHARAAVVEIDGDRLLEEANREAERDGVLSRGRRALRRGQSTVLMLDVPRLRSFGSRPERLLSVTRDKLAEAVGSIAADVAAAGANALVVIGGDTALATFRAMGADGVVLRAEPLRGIPAGVLHGGAMDGAPVVTKAGAFGDEETLLKVFEYLATGRVYR